MKFDYEGDFTIHRPVAPAWMEIRKREKPLPKELPQWVHDEFEDYPELWEFSQLLNVLRKAAEPQDNLLKGLEQIKNRNKDPIYKKSHFRPTYLLQFARLLRLSIEGFAENSEHQLTPAKRKEIANGVKGKKTSIGAVEYARRLRDTLTMLNDGAHAGGPTSPWNEAKHGFRENLSLPGLSPYKSHRWSKYMLTPNHCSSPKEERAKAWNDGWYSGVEDLLAVITDRPREFFNGLIVAMEEWRDAPSFHGQRAGKNGSRNFFAVKMNGWFNKVCKTDLHEFNIALAQVFFHNAMVV